MNCKSDLSDRAASRRLLREMGLRWDSVNHRWHGTTTTDRVQELRERLELIVKCFSGLEVAPKGIGV